MINITNIKSKKRIIIIFSLILVILLSIIVFIILKNKNNSVNKILNKDVAKDDILINKTTFEERENLIKESLAGKFNSSIDKVSVFIARENGNYVNGAFFINNFSGDESFSGYFFAITDDGINIIWADKGSVDCSIITSYNFPKEMAPDCF